MTITLGQIRRKKQYLLPPYQKIVRPSRAKKVHLRKKVSVHALQESKEKRLRRNEAYANIMREVEDVLKKFAVRLQKEVGGKSVDDFYRDILQHSKIGEKQQRKASGWQAYMSEQTDQLNQGISRTLYLC